MTTLIADRELRGGAKLNKFRNVPTVIDGIRFASKAEAKRYSDLKLLERQGDVLNVRRQVPFQLHVGAKSLGKYVADFAYEDGDGLLVVEDVKGVRTDLFNWKAKHFEAEYGFPITIIGGRR